MLKGQPWLGTTQKKQAAVEVRNLGSKAHLVAGKPPYLLCVPQALHESVGTGARSTQWESCD